MNIKVSEDKPNKSKKNYDFYRGYKNHIICDAISGLPIAEFTTTADIKKNKLTSKVNIICDGGLAMHKDGKLYFDSYIKQKFCCPYRKSKDDSLCPCKHEKYFNGKTNRGCVKYISIGTDYRASINHDSIFFKKTYSLRTESERYNSRWKNLNIEQAYVKNINSVTNLNTIALATIKADCVNKSKSLSGLKRIS